MELEGSTQLPNDFVSLLLSSVVCVPLFLLPVSRQTPKAITSRWHTTIPERLSKQGARSGVKSKTSGLV